MEYAGFKRSEGGPVRWGKIATQITDDIAKVEKDRQDKRDVVQKAFDDAGEKFNEIPKGQNKGFNQFIIQGADGVREYRKELAKRIQAGGYEDKNGKWIKLSPSAGTQMIQNTSQDWSNFAREAKNYNKWFADMMKRQQRDPKAPMKPPPAGAYELFLGEDRADLSDMRNKKIVTDPNTGRMSLHTYDKSGNVISTKSLNSINNPENQLADRVDVSGLIKNEFDKAGNFKVWSKGTDGKMKMIASQKLRKDYGQLKANIKNAIMSNDRNIFSVLADNMQGSNFTAYRGDKTGDDYKNKMQNLTDKLMEQAQFSGTPIPRTQAELDAAKLMVATEDDDLGNTQPVFTAEQRKIASDYVEKQIDAQAGWEESQAPSPDKSGREAYDKSVLASSIKGDAMDAINTGDFTRFDPKYQYIAQPDGRVLVQQWNAQDKSYHTKHIIEKGDHADLASYHKDYKDIDAGIYDAAKPNRQPRAKGKTIVRNYTDPSYKMNKVWKSFKSRNDDEKSKTYIQNSIQDAIGKEIPGFPTSGVGLGTIEKATIGDFSEYGNWDDAYQVSVSISPEGGKTQEAGYIIIDYTGSTEENEAIDQHNELVMKRALELANPKKGKYD